MVQIWASVIWAIEPDSFFVILESVKGIRPEIDDFIEFLIQDRLVQIEFESSVS